MKKHNKSLEYHSIGINMVGGMLLFFAIGYWIDKYRGGGTAATLVGMFLGLFYCGYETWKLIEEQKDQ